MDWIKRNLMFVIGAVVSLGLLGVAGFYNFSGWKQNADEREKLNTAYEELKRLNTLNPHPGGGKVDNVKLAKEQQKELTAFIGKLAAHFARIPSIPDTANVTSMEFASVLQQTIDQLQREATNNSVILPLKYTFSFTVHVGRVQFAPGSLAPLAAQLGEVRAICGIQNQSKVNSLDGIRRERVSTDDASGPPTDYLELKSVTNEMAVITPYEVTFRCFTPELAAVLDGMAVSPHGLLVKSINVEPVAASLFLSPEGMAPTPVPAYAPVPAPLAVPGRPEFGAGSDAAFRARYGGEVRGPALPAQPLAALPLAAPVAKPSVQTLVREKQIRVTMLIQVVKLLPNK
jgi:hypothetical protein